MKQGAAQESLIIGAAGSGKSAFAELLCMQAGVRRTYIATMEPFGREGRERVQRHRRMREGKGFTTVERPRNLSALRLEPTDVVLLECLGTLVANELFSDKQKLCSGVPAGLVDELVKGVEALRTFCKQLVIVSNEVTEDGVLYPEETMRYIEVLSLVNARIASRANSVVEVVCGLPVWIKGGAAL